MKNVSIGAGLNVSRLGLGCMGMSEFYGERDDSVSLKVLSRAVELGMTFLDTADMYGPFHNEELIGKFIRQSSRENIQIATKFGIVRNGGSGGRQIDNSPNYIRECCEASLKRLGVDHIDLYYVHRYNPDYPIEEVVGALKDLVLSGKIGHIGLSEVSAATLRRAHAVHPITALQTEYSLWTRHVEEKLLPTCEELGIGFVAYSPLGRGYLTGKYTSPKAFSTRDARISLPRFEASAMRSNSAFADKVKALAGEIDCSPAQFALAWLINQGEHIVPIPGTKSLQYLEENYEACTINLPANVLRRIEAELSGVAIHGDRYGEVGMTGINT